MNNVIRLAKQINYKYGSEGLINLLKIAEDFANKYKTSDEQENAFKKIEQSIRSDLHKLSDKLYKNRHREIVYQLASLDFKSNKKDSPYEKEAYKGWIFCKEVVSRIEYLVSNVDTIDMTEIRKICVEISDLIQKNISASESTPEEAKGQFPGVTALIFLALDSSRRDLRAGRDKAYAQMRSFFSELNGIINGGGGTKHHGILNRIGELEKIIPEKFPTSEETDVDISILPERFEPQRGMLSSNEVLSFIRTYGEEYGLDLDMNLWAKIVVEDPRLFNKMTTVINAIRRGHLPKDGPEMMEELKSIEEEFKQRRITNEPYLNQGESVAPSTPTSVGPAPISLFDKYYK